MDDLKGIFTLAEVCFVHQLFGVREVVWAILRARVRQEVSTTIEQTWKDEQPHGLETQWYENGQIYLKIMWKNGKENGIEHSWHENGQKYVETMWKNGEKHGLEQRWYRHGQKELERIWKDGELEFSQRWDYYGNLRTKFGNDPEEWKRILLSCVLSTTGCLFFHIITAP